MSRIVVAPDPRGISPHILIGPGRSDDMPNVSPHRVILSGPVGERFYRPIREREDIGSMTSLLVSRI